jgi:ribosome biogenesis protein UTP30
MKSQQQEKEATSTKKTLIGDNDDDSDAENAPTVTEPIWLVLSTKKHVADKNRLKPGKISIPHSLYTSSSLSVCLITADPQRGLKDVIADPAFPSMLSSRISKIIGFSKLKARYQSFESRRQLLAEHDLFLADDRILMRLVDTLGKTFYKSSKRPIPVRLEQVERVDGKRVKKDAKKKPVKDERQASFASPLIVAKEIEKALSCTPVQLAPAATTAVRVGTIALTPEQLAENIEAVVQGLTDKFISKGWRNVKAVYIKGPNTMAMPVWLASELWLEDTDVLENTTEEPKALKGSENEKKRKSIDDASSSHETSKKTKKAKNVEDADDTARKAKLQKQKAKALEDGNMSLSSSKRNR